MTSNCRISDSVSVEYHNELRCFDFYARPLPDMFLIGAQIRVTRKVDSICLRVLTLDHSQGFIVEL